VLYFTTEAPQVMPEVLFSVSSKKFKRAVDRNLIKRRCREAYRKNKVLLSRLPPQSRPSSMAFLYIAKEKLEFDVIENGMIRLLKAVRNQQSEVKSRTDRTPPTT
jgi:ribonuclease P protein component